MLNHEYDTKSKGKDNIKKIKISEDKKTITVVTCDNRELVYKNDLNTIARLEQIFDNQASVAIANIPKYTMNRNKSKTHAFAGLIVGGAFSIGLYKNAAVDPVITIASIGTITLVAETLIYAKAIRPVQKLLKEANYFKILRDSGAEIVDYIKSSDNAFVGISEDRKREIISMIDRGDNPTSILSTENMGLTLDEINQISSNKSTEKVYNIKPIPPKTK